MDGLRAQYQRLQATAAGGTVARIQVDAAEHVDRIPRDQAQRVQRRRAGGIIAAQQLLQHGLVHGHATGQRPCRSGLRDRFGTAEVQRRHAQAELTGTIAGRVAHLQRAIGRYRDAAIGNQPGLAVARRLAPPDVDRHRTGLHAGGAGDQVQALVGHRQQAAGDLVRQRRPGIRVGGCERQCIEGRTGLDQHAAATGGRCHQHFRCVQGDSGTDRHAACLAGHRHLRSHLVELPADHHPHRQEGIERVVAEGGTAITRLRLRTAIDDLQ